MTEVTGFFFGGGGGVVGCEGAWVGRLVDE